MTTELGFEVRDPHEGATEARNAADETGPQRVEVPEPGETSRNEGGSEEEGDSLPTFPEVVSSLEGKLGRRLAVNERAKVANYYGALQETDAGSDSTPSNPAERSRQRQDARNRKAQEYGELPFDVRSPHS